MIKMLAAAALLGAPAANPPSAPPAQACLTRQQLGDLSVIGAAVFVEVARTACRRHLPAAAFLAQPAGADFSARLRAEARRRFDPVMQTFAQMSGRDGPMGPIAMRSMLDVWLAEGAGAEFSDLVDAPTCRDASDMIESLSYLPPDRIGRLSASLVSFAENLSRNPALRGAATATPPAPAPAPAPAPGEVRRKAMAFAKPVPVPVLPPVLAPNPAAPAAPIICPE